MADGHLNFDTKIDTSGLKTGVKDIKKVLSSLNKTITSISTTVKSFKTDFGNISTVVSNVNKSIRFLTDEVKKINTYLNNTAKATENVQQDINKVDNSAEKLAESYKQIDKVIDDWAQEQARIAAESQKISEALSYDNAVEDINKVKDGLTEVKEEVKQVQDTGKQKTKFNFFDIFIKSAEKLDNVSSKLADSLSGKKLKVNTDTTGLKALENEIQKSQKYLAGGRKAKNIKLVDTQSTLKDIDKVWTALNKLYERKDKFESLGGDKSSKPFQSLTYDIKVAEAELNRLSQKYIQTLKPKATLNDSGTTTLLENLKTLQSANKAANKSTKTTNKNVKTTEKGVRGLISRFSSMRKSSSKAFGSTGKAIKSSAKKILAYGFGIRSLFRLFNKLRGYAVDAFKAMATQFPEVNKPLSDIQNSFAQAKNSIATAFQPLLTVVAPIITKIMNLFSNAMATVGQFFATLTGQKAIYKATKANGSFAESQDKVAKSTKNANKQLASYDQLQVITQENADSSADSNGASGATGGFVTEAIDPTSQVSDFANKLKEAWAKADFTEIGTIVRDKLVNALNSIDWDSINEKGLKVSSSIATLINGFFAPSIVDGANVYTLGESIGNLIGEAFNSATSFINNFVWKLDTHSIGANITTAIQTAFTSYDWGGLGSLISGIIVKGIDFITGLVNGIDWKALPGQIKDKLIEFLKGVDWKAVLESVARAAVAVVKMQVNLVAGIVTAFWDVLKGVWNKYQDWKKDLEEQGKSIWEGLWEGIKSMAKNAWQWVKDYLFKPIWDAIKDAWGIHSPSTKMAEIGGYIIDGLKNGIGDVWSKIKEAFSTFWRNLSEYLGNIKDNILEKGTNIITGLKDGLGDIWGTIKEKFSTFWKSLSAYFGNIKENMFTKGSNIITRLRDGLGDIWKTIKQKFVDMWESMKTWFSDKVKPKINIKLPTWDDMKAKLKTLVNNAIGFLNKNVIGKINSFLSFTVPDNKATQLLGVAGKSYKLGTIPSIPKLATGAYIPANYGEFLSVLGDNRTQAEIVSPVPEMKKAMLEVISEFFRNTPTNQPIILNLEGRQIASAVWEESAKRYKQTGRAYSY